MLGNEPANEDDVGLGDHTMPVAQRVVHAPHGSSVNLGTQGGLRELHANLDNANRIQIPSMRFKLAHRRDTPHLGSLPIALLVMLLAGGSRKR